MSHTPHKVGSPVPSCPRLGAGPRPIPAKFLEGEKGESFAKAFTKILQHKTKSGKSESVAQEEPILAVRDRTACSCCLDRLPELH